MGTGAAMLIVTIAANSPNLRSMTASQSTHSHVAQYSAGRHALLLRLRRGHKVAMAKYAVKFAKGCPRASSTRAEIVCLKPSSSGLHFPDGPVEVTEGRASGPENIGRVPPTSN